MSISMKLDAAQILEVADDFPDYIKGLILKVVDDNSGIEDGLKSLPDELREQIKLKILVRLTPEIENCPFLSTPNRRWTAKNLKNYSPQFYEILYTLAKKISTKVEAKALFREILNEASRVYDSTILKTLATNYVASKKGLRPVVNPQNKRIFVKKRTEKKRVSPSKKSSPKTIKTLINAPKLPPLIKALIENEKFEPENLIAVIAPDETDINLSTEYDAMLKEWMKNKVPQKIKGTPIRAFRDPQTGFFYWFTK